jgi:outer membrane autotransporter protein
MKKITILTAVFLSLLSHQVFAKTEGFYVGAEVINTASKFRPEWVHRDTNYYRNQDQSNVHNAAGAGIQAKYAFNFDGVFLSPGIFAEQNSFDASSNRHTYSDRLQIRNRYGVKADLGFDTFFGLSPYLTVGYAWVDYRTRAGGRNNGDLVTSVRDDRANRVTFGGGIKLNVSDNVDVGLEYNYQKFYAQTNIPEGASYIEKLRFKTRLDIVKLGLFYKF